MAWNPMLTIVSIPPTMSIMPFYAATQTGCMRHSSMILVCSGLIPSHLLRMAICTLPSINSIGALVFIEGGTCEKDHLASSGYESMLLQSFYGNLSGSLRVTLGTTLQKKDSKYMRRSQCASRLERISFAEAPHSESSFGGSHCILTHLGFPSHCSARLRLYDRSSHQRCQAGQWSLGLKSVETGSCQKGA